MPEDLTSETGATGHHAGGHREAPFDFKTALLHHNMPYPAWEVFHGSPWLVFDLGRYAAINYTELHQDPGLASVDGSAYLTWSKDIKNAPDFRYDVAGLDAEGLSRCMALVAHDRAGLVFPRWLSFLNQQTFFGLVALILVTLLLRLTCRCRPGQVVPSNRFQHAMEALVQYLRDEVVRPLVPVHPDRWVPFLVSIFIVIVTVNLFGLIPGCGTMSGNVGVTAGFAMVTLVVMVAGGMINQGPLAYWLHLVPIPFTWSMSPIWVLLLIIELSGLIIKPVALAIRLFANMFAGHTTLLVLLSLGYIIAANQPDKTLVAGAVGVIGFVLAVLIHLIELLVAAIQAYVFTLLSAIFIGMSLHPEH